MCELLTQIFDDFMERGLHVPTMVTPIVTMLVEDAETKGNHPTQMLAAFQRLCGELRGTLIRMGFQELVSLHGGFDYAFYCLRGNDIVVTYLSNEPRN